MFHPLYQLIHTLRRWPKWRMNEMRWRSEVFFRWRRCRPGHCVEVPRIWVIRDDTVQIQWLVSSPLLTYRLEFRRFVFKKRPFMGHTGYGASRTWAWFHCWCDDLKSWWLARVGDWRRRGGVRPSERGTVKIGDRDAVSITQMFEHLYCIWWVDVAYW